MSEFVFNRPTLVAMAILALLLGFLTFSAGALSGVTWVQRMTLAERMAWRGEEPEPAPPGVEVESAAWSGPRAVDVSPEVSRPATVAEDRVATSPGLESPRIAP